LPEIRLGGLNFEFTSPILNYRRGNLGVKSEIAGTY
jgi:hypothetical protein